MIRRLASIAALGLLAACGGDASEQEDDDARTASGEVLEGTISDAMLPLETLQSQPPLAAPSPGATGAGSAADDAAGEEGETADEGAEATADDEAAAPSEAPAGQSPQ